LSLHGAAGPSVIVPEELCVRPDRLHPTKLVDGGAGLTSVKEVGAVDQIRFHKTCTDAARRPQ
jgi:hypothetical protein